MFSKLILSTRTKSAIGLGLIFVLIVSTICAINSGVTLGLSMVMGVTSPFFIWRFLHCYDDPIWLLKIETIIPFFFYGVVLGYFLNIQPKFNIKYAGAVLACLIFMGSISLLIATLFFENSFDAPRVCQPH